MYDPFKYADNYASEEEYLKELEEENMEKIEIDLDAITKRMDELKKNKAEYKFLLDQTEKEIEKINLQLIALLEQMGVDEMQHGIYRFYWKTTVRNAFDQKLFGSEHPDLLEKYKIPKENRVFEFKING